MKFSKIAAALLLMAGFAGTANAQTNAAQATCKLTNTAANASLYEGDCSVVERQSSHGRTIYEIHMGNGSPFLFAGKKGDTDWMHGADHVHFTDLPTGAIFHWDTFALVVAL